MERILQICFTDMCLYFALALGSQRCKTSILSGALSLQSLMLGRAAPAARAADAALAVDALADAAAAQAAAAPTAAQADTAAARASAQTNAVAASSTESNGRAPSSSPPTAPRPPPALLCGKPHCPRRRPPFWSRRPWLSRHPRGVWGEDPVTVPPPSTPPPSESLIRCIRDAQHVICSSVVDWAAT